MKTWLFLAILFSSQVFADPRVSELKSDIMTLARASEGKPDLDGKLQAALEEKVQDLEKIIPFETSSEKAKKIIGPWRQVFGPYSATGDGSIPFGSRTDKIYQIIYPQGMFYNVALFEKAGVKLVFLLKGEYKITDEAIDGLFVRNSIIAKNVSEEGLFNLPAKVEDGSLSATHLPRQLPPVGQGGKLFEVYADKDIRILRGQTPQFKRPALYIMERSGDKSL
jgi:hypothetical protein